MEFEHSFTIPVPPDKAWDVLLDVERVAPCMPGAAVDSVEGDDVRGRVRVKVGPITMTYAGRARFVDRDPEAHTVTIEASGKEARGTGTASATVHAALNGDDGQTKVTMSTTLNVTGRPAQMGRGVLADVSSRLIKQFADNLAARLAGDSADSTAPGSATAAQGEAPATGPAPAGSPEAPAAGQAEPGHAPVATARANGAAATGAGVRGAQAGGKPGEHDALDLLGIAAGPVLKRVLPLVGALLGASVAAMILLRRRKRRRAS